MVSDGVSVPRAEVPDQRPGQGAPKGIWRLIELEPPGSADFDNPAYEFRRLFSKWLGTFPLLGAGIAVGIAWILRGPADAGGAAAAQGTIEQVRVHRDGA